MPNSNGAIPFHPLANRFPLMEGAEFDQFVEHMRSKGFDPKQPIIILEGMILDGRNRYRACDLLSIAPATREYAGEWGTPEEYVRKVNRFRCHYTQGQLAIIAAEEHERLKRSPGQQPVKGAANTPLKSAAKVAEDFGVSKSILHQAKRVRKQGTQAVNDLVANGQASLQDAVAVLQQPKEVQDAAAKKVASGEARTLAEGMRGDAHDGNGQAGPKEKLFDSVGQPVPVHLRDVFATKLFDEYTKKLNELLGLSATMLAASPWWQADGDTTKKLTEIKQRVKDARPYAVCPECERSKKGCQSCRMQGWTTYWVYDEMHMRGASTNQGG